MNAFTIQNIPGYRTLTGKIRLTPVSNWSGYFIYAGLILLLSMTLSLILFILKVNLAQDLSQILFPVLFAIFAIDIDLELLGKEDQESITRQT